MTSTSQKKKAMNEKERNGMKGSFAPVKNDEGWSDSVVVIKAALLIVQLLPNDTLNAIKARCWCRQLLVANVPPVRSALDYPCED